MHERKEVSPDDDYLMDEVFLDALEMGEEAVESLRNIDPVLWTKGIIALNEHRQPSTVTTEEFWASLDIEGQWPVGWRQVILSYIEERSIK